MAVIAGQRPEIAAGSCDSLPKLQKLMGDCLFGDPSNRPSFAEVETQLPVPSIDRCGSIISISGSSYTRTLSTDTRGSATSTHGGDEVEQSHSLLLWEDAAKKLKRKNATIRAAVSGQQQLVLSKTDNGDSEICYSLVPGSFVSTADQLERRKSAGDCARMSLSKKFYFKLHNMIHMNKAGEEPKTAMTKAVVLAAVSEEERADWVKKINKAIECEVERALDNRAQSGCVKWLEVIDQPPQAIKLALCGEGLSASRVLSGLQRRHNGSYDNCGLVSIFGKARQGKSFLMNCLASHEGLFEISNKAAACTHGVDLSLHTMALDEFAGSKFGHRSEGERTTCDSDDSRMMLNFVDAEGMGDKDVQYDSMLLTPVLLLSKVVIFNHKGGLQKDDILQQLYRFSDSASRIDVGHAQDSNIFGHLHLVFRDWEFEDEDDPDADEGEDEEQKMAKQADIVKKKIFEVEVEGRERSNSSTSDVVHDKIRKALQSTFCSITVWLLPVPCYDTRELKKKITFEKVNDEFKAHVQAMKRKIAAQLVEEAGIGSNAVKDFDGLAKMMELAVKSMNDDLRIQPKSMFEEVAKRKCEEAEKQFRRKCEEAEEQFSEAWKGEYKNTNSDVWNESYAESVEQRLVEEMKNKLEKAEVPEAMVEQAVEAISSVVEATRKDNAHRQILQKKDSQLEVVSGSPIASREHREPLKNETIIVTKCRHFFGLSHSRVNSR
jgi:hypothetical protein